jgi:capsular polysaccharide biosynthesis protein
MKAIANGPDILPARFLGGVMDLRIFLRAVWANGLAIGAGVLICAGLVYAVSTTLRRSYVAEARLVVEAGLGLTGSSTDAVLAAPLVGQTYAVMATTRPVLLDVIARAGLALDPVALQQRIVVAASLNTPFMTITMTDADPAVAAAGANAMAEALIEVATTRSVVGAPPTQLLKSVEPATPPTDYSGPRPLLNTLLSASAFLVALLMLLATVVYLRESRTETAGARGGGRPVSAGKVKTA